MIHQRDAQDALGSMSKQWQQLKYTYETKDWGLKTKDYKNIVLAGMGGSALAAEIFTSWPKTNLPFEIVRDYDLPEYVGKDTLFIASSYSGNTEETLSALAQAEEKGCAIAVIAAGGELEKVAAAKNYPFLKLPGGLQPRMAVFYNFAALMHLFISCGLTSQDKLAELHKAADWLGRQAQDLEADTPASKNKAKQIAQELMGNSVVIYSGPKLFPAAYKWKININENAKNIAWCNQYPEFNHNEFIGWTSHPVDKPYKIIELKSDLEHARIQKRLSVSGKLLSGKRPHPETIDVVGDNELEQLLWSIQLGDFVSVYLALLNGLNPTPVDLIEKLKSELKNQ
ncbi:MAG TPA: bifunctional phosphoglucose/phosphomannose isomerase [Candidatus Saccharimonadales bacterium]|nr:bifunctional phosphoglucose/phosphomannose isomerase [Candidatus Saccharimonadales bacterium]